MVGFVELTVKDRSKSKWQVLMGNPFTSVSRMIERIGIVESDSPDERVRKTVLVAFAIVVGSAAVVWGVIYVLFDEPLAGSIPLILDFPDGLKQ